MDIVVNIFGIALILVGVVMLIYSIANEKSSEKIKLSGCTIAVVGALFVAFATTVLSPTETTETLETGTSVCETIT